MPGKGPERNKKTACGKPASGFKPPPEEENRWMKPMDGPLRDTGCCPRLPIGKTIDRPPDLPALTNINAPVNLVVDQFAKNRKLRKNARTPGKKKNLALYGFQTGRIFCANSPSQKARGASYNFLLLLRKDCLLCHRSECYGPPSPSISLESIKSQESFAAKKKSEAETSLFFAREGAPTAVMRLTSSSRRHTNPRQRRTSPGRVGSDANHRYLPC